MVIVGLLVLVDFRKVMMTSPPELAHCALPPPPSHQTLLNEDARAREVAARDRERREARARTEELARR